MMRITARHADEWNTWGDVEAATTKTDSVLRRVRRGRARPGDDAPLRAGDRVLGRRRRARSRELRENAPAGRSIVGSASELVDTIGPVPPSSGFDEFIVPDWNFGRDLDARLAKIDRFRTESPATIT